MARILVNDDWYDEVTPTAFYEAEFENVIVHHAQVIFPEFIVVPFKTLVFDDEGGARPDLALIDRDYLCWWVVEIEMAHHSLEKHVLPQVRTLSRAIYGADQVAFLLDQHPSLDPTRLLDMMKGKQPQVLIIVNNVVPEWSQSLARYDATVAFLEVFRSAHNRHVFRLNGGYPIRSAKVVAHCMFDPILPRFLNIDAPAALAVPRGGKVKIWFENGITEWQRVDSQDKVWLSPQGPNPLSKISRYDLIRQSDGSLVLCEHK